MSAESKQSQSSIDDILSSIREIIADDSAVSDGANGEHAQSPSNGTASENHSDIISVLRGHENSATQSAQETGPPPAEDVLDLSEEFIVTEATAAVRRAHERREAEQDETQNEAAGDHSPIPQDASASSREDVTAEDVPAEEVAAEETGAEELAEDVTSEDRDPEAAEQDVGASAAQADVWPQDFQMPVGEEGPASPFTATQKHPESAWPGSDPFDAADSYKLARSFRSDNHFWRGKKDEHHAQTQAPEAAPAPEVDDKDHAEAEDQASGIELTSLSEPAPATGPALSDDTWHDRDEAGAAAEAHEPYHFEDQASAAQLHVFSAVDEIEAVFGMPPRSWAEPASAAPEADDLEAEDEAPGAEHAGSVEAGTFDTDTPAISEPQHDEGLASSPSDEDVAGGSYHHEPPEFPSASAGHTAHDAIAQAATSSGGKSLEESVKELLRPMLQEWLDKNMPRLVEAAMREQVAAGQTDETEAEKPGDPAHDDEDHHR